MAPAAGGIVSLLEFRQGSGLASLQRILRGRGCGEGSESVFPRVSGGVIVMDSCWPGYALRGCIVTELSGQQMGPSVRGEGTFTSPYVSCKVWMLL